MWHACVQVRLNIEAVNNEEQRLRFQADQHEQQKEKRREAAHRASEAHSHIAGILPNGCSEAQARPCPQIISLLSPSKELHAQHLLM